MTVPGFHPPELMSVADTRRPAATMRHPYPPLFMHLQTQGLIMHRLNVTWETREQVFRSGYSHFQPALSAPRGAC